MSERTTVAPHESGIEEPTGPATGADPARSQDASGTRWPEPQPLPEPLPPVALFDAEMLPEQLRGWVMDIAERMQCPPDYPAAAALVGLSGLIGARAVMAPKEHDDWRVVPNLWGVVIGRPGVMKSPAISEALKPLARLEHRERERWRAEHADWELDRQVAELVQREAERSATKKARTDRAAARELLRPVEVEPEPLMRRYIVNDSTQEKLADLLVSNPWGVLVHRDELHGLIASMDKQGQEGARGFFLTAHDGNQGYAVDRIMRGSSYVPRVCLAMLGGMQPAKVQRYVRDAVGGGAGDDGLLQRFGLAVWPDVPREWRKVDRWPDTPARQAAWDVFERLNALQPSAEDEPQEWRFTPEAQAMWWQWTEGLEHELRGDDLHPAIASHLAKYRKLVPAMALLFALIDTPEAGKVAERELVRALAWGDYLRTHAERLYAAATIPETAGAELLLKRIRAGRLADADGAIPLAFTPREVAVKHWAGLQTVEEVRRAADMLADHGWLLCEEMPAGAQGGRPSVRYAIHPELLPGGAA